MPYSRLDATIKVAQHLHDWNSMTVPVASDAAISAVAVLEREGYLSFDKDDASGSKPDEVRHVLRQP